MRTLTLVILFAVFSTLAFAHANLFSAYPAPYSSINQSPSNITIKYTEAVEPDFSSITILNFSGDALNTTNSSVDPSDKTVMILPLPKLEDGPYIVHWRTMSAVDGHVVESSYVIRVGNSTGVLPQVQGADHGPSPTEIILRWFTYLLETAFVSVCAFSLFVFSPTTEFQKKEKFMATFRSWRRYSVLFLLVVSLLYEVYLAASNGPLSALNKNIDILASETFFGHILDVKIVVLGVILGLDFLLSGLGIDEKKEWGVFLFGGLLVLLAGSMSSHSAAAAGIAGVISDWAHQISGMIWLGAIFLITFASYQAKRMVSEEEARRLVKNLVPGFSKLSLWCLIIASLSGIYLGIVNVKSLENLWGSAYGQILLVKIAVVIIIVLFGYLKRFSIYRIASKALMRTAGSLENVSEAALISLLSGVLLLSIALLSASSPPSVSNSTPTLFSKQIGDITINLTISPFKPGTNNFTIGVYDSQGKPLENITDIRVYFDYQDKNIGKLSAELGAPKNGTMSISGDFLALPGNWSITIDVTRKQYYDSLADYEFNLPPDNGTIK